MGMWYFLTLQQKRSMTQCWLVIPSVITTTKTETYESIEVCEPEKSTIWLWAVPAGAASAFFSFLLLCPIGRFLMFKLIHILRYILGVRIIIIDQEVEMDGENNLWAPRKDRSRPNLFKLRPPLIDLLLCGSRRKKNPVGLFSRSNHNYFIIFQPRLCQMWWKTC